MTSATVRRNRPLRCLAALCVVALLASPAFAQEGEKKQEKPDLAKRALDVLFDSGAEKDADAEKPAEKSTEKTDKTEKTEETKPADSETKPATGESGEAAAPAKPATGGAATPGAPWPNKPATGGATTGEGATKPKPFVPPGTGATGETPTKPAPVKPIPSDPAKPAPGTSVLAPKPVPAPVAPTAKTYKIAPGDTFSSIAIALYNDEKKWAAIAQANPLVDPTKLKVGQEIRLPDLAKAAEEREHVLAEAAEAVAKPGAAATTVTVQPGDTLSHIAHRVYGKAKYWTVIFEANKDQLKDAGDVKVGQKLKIPPKPSE